MVAPKQENKNLIYDIKLSSVVPAKATGDNNNHELRGMDIAMKLHYIKALYLFRPKKNNAALVESIDQLKHTMFDWLVPYFVTCGRVCVGGGGDGCGRHRPCIKVNDAGVRVVEGKCGMTVEEWLGMDGFVGVGVDQLVYGDFVGNNGLGLGFTPLVFIQVTFFKCGGISLGLHWAHILGDIHSASTFMNMLGHYLQAHPHHPQIQTPNPQKPKSTPLPGSKHGPLSLKRVDPVGEIWTIPTNCKMVTHSFQLTTTQLNELLTKANAPPQEEHYFEVVSSILWKSIARVRNYRDSNLATVFRVVPSLAPGTVQVDGSLSEIDLSELMVLMKNNVSDETREVEEMVDNDCEDGGGDFVVYGSNLTFVDMEASNVYELNINGQCPSMVVYTINGVGEKGVVLVHPWASNEDNVGKLVVVVVPHHEIEELKVELKESWGIIM